MSVRIYLHTDEVKEKLAELEKNQDNYNKKIFSMDVDIDDIDHNDLENEDWYEDRFGDHLDDDDLSNAREEGYDDGYENGKEETEKDINNNLLILRDMLVINKSNEDIVEKLKEILRNKGLN